jgi:RimJ/RimL family protein N-acetyltransferase
MAFGPRSWQETAVMTLKTTGCSMHPTEFRAYHEPSLEPDDVKHGLILNALRQMGVERSVGFSYWTLGRSGECAVKMGRYSIVLGALDENQCRNLAELTAHTDYPGVIGPDLTASWFADRAGELGLQFLEPDLLQIYSISDKPRYPGAFGHPQPVTIKDATLLADWLIAFHREADPHDPVPVREELERAAGEDRFLFWIDKGRPVSMAGIVRRLKHSAAIAAVYTPPELRGRGYAGSATAATVERIFAEGRKIACLYADLRNPASNRCYAKIGFTPVCKSLHFHRTA